MTNTPTRRASNIAILAVVPFVFDRRVVRDNITGYAEYRDASSTRADPYSRIAPGSSLRGLFSLHGCLLSMSGHPDYSPGQGGLFPQLVSGSLAEVSGQPVQDSSGWQGKNFPVSIIVFGHQRTAIRLSYSIPLQGEGPFPLSNFLRSLVFHVLKGVMEQIEKHGKAFGDFKNVGRTSSVGNPAKENSAGWHTPIRERAHLLRCTKTRLVP